MLPSQIPENLVCRMYLTFPSLKSVIYILEPILSDSKGFIIIPFCQLACSLSLLFLKVIIIIIIIIIIIFIIIIIIIIIIIMY